MHIYINKLGNKKPFKLRVSKDETVEQVQNKFKDYILEDDMCNKLYSNGEQLENNKTLEYYNIKSTTILYVIDPLETLEEMDDLPLKENSDNDSEDSSSNIPPSAKKKNSQECFGSCFAHAVASAYIDMCNKIPKCPVPEFGEAFDIAYYDTQTEIPTALVCMENFYSRGLVWNAPTKEYPTVKEIMLCSVIMLFLTTDQGWEQINEGKLLKKPVGDVSESTCWHAALIEDYNFNGTVKVKKSWNKLKDGNSGSCDIWLPALHQTYFITVKYTRESIANKDYNFQREVIFGPECRCVCPDWVVGMSCWFLDDKKSSSPSHYWGKENFQMIRHGKANAYPGFRVDDYIQAKLDGHEFFGGVGCSLL